MLVSEVLKAQVFSKKGKNHLLRAPRDFWQINNFGNDKKWEKKIKRIEKGNVMMQNKFECGGRTISEKYSCLTWIKEILGRYNPTCKIYTWLYFSKIYII